MPVIKYQVVRIKMCSGETPIRRNQLIKDNIEDINEAYKIKENWDKGSSRFIDKNSDCQCECEVREVEIAQ